jgi:hypothetical protein
LATVSSTDISTYRATSSTERITSVYIPSALSATSCEKCAERTITAVTPYSSSKTATTTATTYGHH